MIQERPGKTVFRYWQEGPGFDRNLNTIKAIQASIDYIHNNPVQRKLCKRAIDWKWSSARRFLFPEAPIDPDLPHIHGLPAEFWDGLAGKWTDGAEVSSIKRNGSGQGATRTWTQVATGAVVDDRPDSALGKPVAHISRKVVQEFARATPPTLIPLLVPLTQLISTILST